MSYVKLVGQAMRCQIVKIYLDLEKYHWLTVKYFLSKLRSKLKCAWVSITPL